MKNSHSLLFELIHWVFLCFDTWLGDRKDIWPVKPVLFISERFVTTIRHLANSLAIKLSEKELVNASVFIVFACTTCDSYPKIEFYHTDGVRTMMVDILFIYAKLKPETSYRQVLSLSSSVHWVLCYWRCRVLSQFDLASRRCARFVYSFRMFFFNACFESKIFDFWLQNFLHCLIFKPKVPIWF